MPAPLPEQVEILTEVGDPNGTLASVIDIVWDLYADKALIRADLQGLYTKRACLDRRLAEEQQATDVTISGEISDKESGRFDHVQVMRDQTHAEIVRIEVIVRSSHAPATGKLTTTAPISPPSPLGPDANDPTYRGDAYGWGPGPLTRP